MIIPKREAKSYGAVHIDNYLSFAGFCKKVDSEDIQDVDVYLDDKKIDTIVADKNIEKISAIYDIEGHAFIYDLPEDCFEKSHKLQFKCGKEELVNSPIQTIEKTHPKFNEYRFMHSLSNVDKKDIHFNKYTPKVIGVIMSMDNLNDQFFVDYLVSLLEKNNNIFLKIFYYNKDELEKIHNKFKENNRITFETLKDIRSLTQSIEIFIYNRKTRTLNYNEVFYFIIKFCNNIYVSYFGQQLIFNNKFDSIYLRNYFDFGFTVEDIDSCNLNIINLLHNKISDELNIKKILLSDIEKTNNFYNYNIIYYAVKNNEYKKYLITYEKELYKNRHLKI